MWKRITAVIWERKMCTLYIVALNTNKYLGHWLERKLTQSGCIYPFAKQIKSIPTGSFSLLSLIKQKWEKARRDVLKYLLLSAAIACHFFSITRLCTHTQTHTGSWRGDASRQSVKSSFKEQSRSSATHHWCIKQTFHTLSKMSLNSNPDRL